MHDGRRPGCHFQCGLGQRDDDTEEARKKRPMVAPPGKDAASTFGGAADPEEAEGAVATGIKGYDEPSTFGQNLR